MTRPAAHVPLLSSLSASSSVFSPSSSSSSLSSSFLHPSVYRRLLWVSVCCSLLVLVSCDALLYAPRAAVSVLVNNVGPFHNPAESYKFYSLPYCEPSAAAAPRDDEPHNLGEILAGDRRRPSPYELRFTVPDEQRLLCEKQLTGEQVDAFIQAIRRHSVFELFVDELAVKGARAHDTHTLAQQPATLCSSPLSTPLTLPCLSSVLLCCAVHCLALHPHSSSQLRPHHMGLGSSLSRSAVVSAQGFVGEMEEDGSKGGRHRVSGEEAESAQTFLFTHLDFSIAYNGDHVIAVNLTTDPTKRVELLPGQPKAVSFSYSTRWQPSQVPFAERDEYHAASSMHDQSIEIHWLSIINSFVLVLLLTAFLAVILMRVLNKDFARYMEIDEEEGEEEDEEVGWKLVHGDVFRTPQAAILLAAIVGNGAQMLTLIIAILTLAIAGTFYPGNRGALYSAAVVLYAATAFIAGFVSTRLYLQLGGSRWASNSVLTATLFSVPFFLTFTVVNGVAWAYGSSSALPLATILLIVAFYTLVSFPLTVFGSMRARRHAGSYDSPCKTNRVEREIPPSPFYRSALFHFIIGGFLPFSAIYIELHYIFVAIYGPRVYTLYGILSLAFVMLIIVTAFITVALTYFQLASEDYHWWWRSVGGGCSVGVFMYLYAAFYYVYRSDMSGPLQGAFFFGYLLMVSYAFALLCAAVAFLAARQFVRHIYTSSDRHPTHTAHHTTPHPPPASPPRSPLSTSRVCCAASRSTNAVQQAAQAKRTEEGGGARGRQLSHMQSTARHTHTCGVYCTADSLCPTCLLAAAFTYLGCAMPRAMAACSCLQSSALARKKRQRSLPKPCRPSQSARAVTA